CRHRCTRRSLQFAVELRGGETRRSGLENVVSALQLGVLAPEALQLLVFAARHACSFAGVDLGAPDPAAHGVGGDAYQLMNAPERSRSRLLGRLAAALLEEPDHSFSRLGIVLARHDPYSPIVGEKSLYRTQDASMR